MNEFLPWQQQAAQSWLADRTRFAHAWLIYGQPGIGQRNFAFAGAASLLCEQTNNGLACGKCQACAWVSAGNHPDLRLVRPDAIALQEGDTSVSEDGKKKPSQEIRIEQIRSIIPWCNLAAHRSGNRVVLLYPADSLNPAAANSLLKILEEPPAQTVFLLCANSPQRLLPTLLSRCRRLLLSTPTQAQSLAWLEQQGVQDATTRLAAAGGAPMLAYEQAGQDSIPAIVPLFLSAFRQECSSSKLADALASQDAYLWLDNLQRLWLDISLVAHKQPPRYYPGLLQQIEPLAAKLKPGAWAANLNWLNEQKNLAQHPLNPKFLADYASQRLCACFNQ